MGVHAAFDVMSRNVYPAGNVTTPNGILAIGAIDPEDSDAGLVYKSLEYITVELDDAMKCAEERRKARDSKGAISQFTHVINCANTIRSFRPDNFILGVQDSWVSATH
jgi:hypothetical protein